MDHTCILCEGKSTKSQIIVLLNIILGLSCIPNLTTLIYHTVVPVVYVFFHF